MKIYEISNKTYLVRHWLRWYTVQRGFTDWQKLTKHGKGKPFNLNKTVNKLQAKYGKQETSEITSLISKNP